MELKLVYSYKATLLSDSVLCSWESIAMVFPVYTVLLISLCKVSRTGHDGDTIYRVYMLSEVSYCLIKSSYDKIYLFIYLRSALFHTTENLYGTQMKTKR